MAEQGITEINYFKEEIEIGGSGYSEKDVYIIKAGQGVLEAGQVLAYEASDASLKMVKYVAGASNGTEVIRGVLMRPVDATLVEVSEEVLRQGWVNEAAIKGINVIASDVIVDPATVTKLTGGTLTAAAYEYKVVGISRSGNTIPSTGVTGTTETTNLILEVAFELPVTMDTVRIYRDDTDYYDVTEAELVARKFLDDGSKVWTAGVPVTATDFAGFKSLEAANIYPKKSENGYYLGR